MAVTRRSSTNDDDKKKKKIMMMMMSTPSHSQVAVEAGLRRLKRRASSLRENQNPSASLHRFLDNRARICSKVNHLLVSTPQHPFTHQQQQEETHLGRHEVGHIHDDDDDDDGMHIIVEELMSDLQKGGWSKEEASEMMTPSSSPSSSSSSSLTSDTHTFMHDMVLHVNMYSDTLSRGGWSAKDIEEAFHAFVWHTKPTINNN